MTSRASAAANLLAQVAARTKTGMGWQTYGMPERFDVKNLVRDLDKCRQRGLDGLDVDTVNQKPLDCDTLELLARDYVTARFPSYVATGRITQIKLLMRHGIADFGEQVDRADANLIRDLYFGAAEDGSIDPPGVLLKKARKPGEPETRFRRRRHAAIESFAAFLIAFLGLAGGEPAVEPVVDADPEPQAISLDSAEESHLLATIGYVDNNDHFIDMLAKARQATIVGITNEGLMPMLEQALAKKRGQGGPGAFWDMLRIVFLGEELLAGVNDEREAIGDTREALRQRRWESAWARRSLGAFLKRNQPPAHWALYKCPKIPSLTGSLLEFGDGSRVADLVIRSGRRPIAENLHLEIKDPGLLSEVFEDIVSHSGSNENVPVGAPTGGVFQCDQLRMHSKVLKDGSDQSGWLPMVLLVTAQRRRTGQVEPILQVRTPVNSARELDHLSHLGGHIFQEDCAAAANGEANGHWSFALESGIPAHAAQRLIREVTGFETFGEPEPVKAGSYLYPDKEHLFFFIFSLVLPEGAQIPRRTEMHPIDLTELVEIRGDQVLRTAADLCRVTDASDRYWASAAQIVALNLALHDRVDLGEELTALAGRDIGERQEAADRIIGLTAERASPSWGPGSSRISLLGLAGWQYREFFSVLLPCYEAMGVAGATELLTSVQADSVKREAVVRLEELYQDEHLMAHMPIEL